MSQPILTEDEIFSASINSPPSSSAEEVGAGVEDLDCFETVDVAELAMTPSTLPDTELAVTPTLDALQVHLEAISELSSMQPHAMQQPIPNDPDYVAHSVATWPNEGIGLTAQDLHHLRQRRPGSWRRSDRVKASATGTGFEGLVVPRTQILEFARFKSNLLFPLVLGSPTRNALPDMSCKSSNSEPQMPAPAVQAFVQHPLPTQRFSGISSPEPAPVVEQFHEPITSAAFSNPLQPLPQRTCTPPTNAPAELSTTVTTIRVANTTATGATPTGVDVATMSTTVEFSYGRAQVQITTPRVPTLHDLSSPMMTAPAELQVSILNPKTPGAREQGSGSECGLHRSTTWSNKGSPIDWPNAIDCMPEPDLEFPSPYRERPHASPIMVTAENSILVPEQVPQHLPVPKQSFFLEECHRITPPMEPSFSITEPRKRRRTKQRQEGTSEDNAPDSCGTSEHNVPIMQTRLKWTGDLHKRFEDALTRLGGPRSATPKSVRYVMNCEGVTNYHVKSHLQKYRADPHCFDDRSQSSEGEDSVPVNMEGYSKGKMQRRHRRGSKATSAEKTAHEMAARTLAETLAMQHEIQQQLPQLMEQTKELQAKVDVMEKQGEQLQKQGEQLQRMITDQRAMRPIMGPTPGPTGEAAAGAAGRVT